MYSDPFIDKTIHNYTLKEKIGKGVQGTIYKAYHSSISQLVAVKLLEFINNKNMAQDKNILKPIDSKEAECVIENAIKTIPEQDSQKNIKDCFYRFIREATSLCKVKSPEVVFFHNVGFCLFGPHLLGYLIMEYVEGISLEQYLNQHPGGFLPCNTTTLEIIKSLCRGLKAIHDAGLVHRDIKPQNILVNKETIKICDFGLAKPCSDEYTLQGELLGTPLYMAPELWSGGKEISSSADLYSLGAMIYRMITGKPVFEGNSMSLFYQHIQTPAPSLCKIQANIPKKLDEIVLKLLEKKPTNRYQNAEEILREIDKIALEKSVSKYNIFNFFKKIFPVKKEIPGKEEIYVQEMESTAATSCQNIFQESEAEIATVIDVPLQVLSQPEETAPVQEPEVPEETAPVQEPEATQALSQPEETVLTQEPEVVQTLQRSEETAPVQKIDVAQIIHQARNPINRMEIRQKILQLLFPTWELDITMQDFWKGIQNRLTVDKEYEQDIEVWQKKCHIVKMAIQTERYCQEKSDYLREIAEEDRNFLQRYLQTRKNIDCIGTLEYGSQGITFLLLEQKKFRFFCIKVVSGSLAIEEIEEKKELLKEIFHPGLIGIYDIEIYSDNAIYELEYFPSLSLFSCKEKVYGFEIPAKIDMAKKIVESMLCLHETDNLFWGDVQEKKILIDILGDHDLKGCDFGLAEKNIEDSNNMQQKDIKDFGKLFYSLLCKKDFQSNTQESMIYTLLPDIDNSIKELLWQMIADTKKFSLKEIHVCLSSWTQKYFRKNLARQSDIYREYLLQQISFSSCSKIEVKTESGIARMLVDKGMIWEATYGKIEGKKVLEELFEPTTLIYEVFKESLNPSIEQKDSFCLKDISRHPELKDKRNQIKEKVLKCIDIKDKEIQCSHCKNCAKKSPRNTSEIRRGELDDLLYSTNFFLYSKSRYALEIWHKKCLIQDAKETKISGATLHYDDYPIAYLGENICTRFYLGFPGTSSRNYLLYQRPCTIKKEQWFKVMDRIQRGYEILKDYPSRYLLNFKDFHRKEIGTETLAVLSLEYFPGIYLQQILNHPEISFSNESKGLILLDIAEALQILHSKGVVHRNIHPGSILLGVNGQVKLGDFSFCKYDYNSPEGDITDHYTNTLGSTVQLPAKEICYRSPAQAKDPSWASIAGDIWSWGVLAYELFTGISPFFKENDRKGTFCAIQNLEPGLEYLPCKFSNLIKKALVKEEKKRTLSSQEVIEELKKILFL